MIGRYVPSHMMPVDQYGNRAHILLDPSAPTRRLNLGMLYEPGINAIAECVRRHMHAAMQEGNPKKAWDLLMTWFNQVDPSFAEEKAEEYASPFTGTPDEATKKDARKHQYLLMSIERGVRTRVLPFLKSINEENMLRWAKYWGLEVGPVTYVVKDQNGVEHTKTSKYPVLIAKKYTLLLSKIPHARSAGFSTVSHVGLPIKPGVHTKASRPISESPIRFGEDEMRNLLMSNPSETVARFFMLLGNSLAGAEVLARDLLTASHPTRLKRARITNQELHATNIPASIFHHKTATLGVDTRRTKTKRALPNFGVDVGILDIRPDDTLDEYVGPSDDPDTPDDLPDTALEDTPEDVATEVEDSLE